MGTQYRFGNPVQFRDTLQVREPSTGVGPTADEGSQVWAHPAFPNCTLQEALTSRMPAAEHVCVWPGPAVAASQPSALPSSAGCGQPPRGASVTACQL